MTMHSSGFFEIVKDIVHKPKRIFTEPIPDVSGMRYIQNWISDEDAKELLYQIDYNPWDKPLQRRTQQYGYKYDYFNPRRKEVLGKLPPFLFNTCKRLFEEKLFDGKYPNQVIINEYQSGQGIAPHIDSRTHFSDTIVSLSLGSDTIMLIKDNKNNTLPLTLHENSLLILQGKSRYECTHGIRGMTYDVIDGVKKSRKRRVSVTFRRVIED